MSAALTLAARFTARGRAALASQSLQAARELYDAVASSPLGAGENTQAIAEVIAAAREQGRAEVQAEALAEARAMARGAVDAIERAAVAACAELRSRVERS